MTQEAPITPALHLLLDHRDLAEIEHVLRQRRGSDLRVVRVPPLSPEESEARPRHISVPADIASQQVALGAMGGMRSWLPLAHPADVDALVELAFSAELAEGPAPEDLEEEGDDDIPVDIDLGGQEAEREVVGAPAETDGVVPVPADEVPRRSSGVGASGSDAVPREESGGDSSLALRIQFGSPSMPVAVSAQEPSAVEPPPAPIHGVSPSTPTPAVPPPVPVQHRYVAPPPLPPAALIPQASYQQVHGAPVELDVDVDIEPDLEPVVGTRDAAESAPEAEAALVPEPTPAPEGAAESAPEAEVALVPEPAPASAPEGAAESAPEVEAAIEPEPAPESAPEPAPEGAAESAPEVEAAIEPEPAPESAPEPAPEPAPEGAALSAPEAEVEQETVGTSEPESPAQVTDDLSFEGGEPAEAIEATGSTPDFSAEETQEAAETHEQVVAKEGEASAAQAAHAPGRITLETEPPVFSQGSPFEEETAKQTLVHAADLAGEAAAADEVALGLPEAEGGPTPAMPTGQDSGIPREAAGDDSGPNAAVAASVQTAVDPSADIDSSDVEEVEEVEAVEAVEEAGADFDPDRTPPPIPLDAATPLGPRPARPATPVGPPQAAVHGEIVTSLPPKLESSPPSIPSEARPAVRPPAIPAEGKVAEPVPPPPLAIPAEGKVAEPVPPPPPVAALDSARAKKAKKFRKAWYEEFFDDDYLRTLPSVTRSHCIKEAGYIKERLQLSPGQRVLDIGCGYGRHAIELALSKIAVTGIDTSLPLLIKAAELTRGEGVEVDFLHQDMREMTFDATFDGAYCVMTSFGYFDDETNQEVVRRVYKALKPGARFLLEVINRDFVLGDLPSRVWWEGDECVVMDEVEFNFLTSRIISKRSVAFADGRSIKHDLSIRAYCLHELGRLLHEAGFKVSSVTGSTSTEERFFGQYSPYLIILARK